MDGITIKRIRTLRGANIWAYCQVLEIHVDIGRYEDLPSDKIPGFADRLLATMPSLIDHKCSEGYEGGFLERLRLGTYMGHVLEHVILELQSLAGMPTTFGRTRSAGKTGEYYVIVHYRDEAAGAMCARLGLEIVEALADSETLPFDLTDRLAAIRRVGEDNMIGPSTWAIIDAARQRGIPWFRLTAGSLIQLGQGKYARRIQAAATSNTSFIAAGIASDKELTKELLAKVGVPVPKGEMVRGSDAAWAAARALRGPVVVKPRDGNQGKGVSVNLTTEEQVREAYELARDISRYVMVERYLAGHDYRILVVGGKMIAAARRQPPQVTGDGVHTIDELVAVLNTDPRRGHGHGAAMTRIRIDASAELTLSKQGYTLDSVPDAGAVVLLRDNSNLSTGGSAADVTFEVHPENAELAELAAQTVGLDISGIDMICDNLALPIRETGGGIVEVNGAPGLRMHVFPSEGEPQPVGEAIVAMLFPEKTQARVPLIAVTGTNGKTTVTRMIGHIYAAMGLYVGMANTDGIYFGGVRHVKSDASGPRSAESVLQHPRVEVAVLETARGGILRSGLAWDRSTVSVVLNVAGDHLGIGGIDTIEQLARVKRVIVESVAKDGYAVLNADDPLVVEMAPYATGSILYFARSAASPVLQEHVEASGMAAYLEDGGIVLDKGGEKTTLVAMADVPATHGGLIPFQALNALAAAAACWGAGVPLESIRSGLETFRADDKAAPGRFNLFEVRGAKIIIDYGHNPHAMAAMAEAIHQMNPQRAIGVIAAPGDRRDEDIAEVARIAAGAFDEIIVREDDDTRGRRRGALAELMCNAITKVRPELPITVVLDEIESSQQALNMAQPGVLVVIFADKVDKIIEMVRKMGS